MATYRYFNGMTELTNVGRHTEDRFMTGTDPANPPVYDRIAKKWTGYVKVERTIRMKAMPSKHECDARCMNATGRNMECECACGGKNHGRGSFSCVAA